MNFTSTCLYLSGIVAVLFCGLSQARYTVHNLSSEGRARTEQVGLQRMIEAYCCFQTAFISTLTLFMLPFDANVCVLRAFTSNH